MTDMALETKVRMLFEDGINRQIEAIPPYNQGFNAGKKSLYLNLGTKDVPLICSNNNILDHIVHMESALVENDLHGGFSEVYERKFLLIHPVFAKYIIVHKAPIIELLKDGKTFSPLKAICTINHISKIDAYSCSYMPVSARDQETVFTVLCGMKKDLPEIAQGELVDGERMLMAQWAMDASNDQMIDAMGLGTPEKPVNITRENFAEYLMDFTEMISEVDKG